MNASPRRTKLGGVVFLQLLSFLTRNISQNFGFYQFKFKKCEYDDSALRAFKKTICLKQKPASKFSSKLRVRVMKKIES